MPGHDYGLAPGRGGGGAPARARGSWVFFGCQDNGASSRRILLRKTDQDAPPADTTVAVTDQEIRLARVGNTSPGYRGRLDRSWTQRATATLTLPAEARIGLLLAADEKANTQLRARFEFFRFTVAGEGLGNCRKIWEECMARDNTVQYNGWKELPDDRLAI